LWPWHYLPIGEELIRHSRGRALIDIKGKATGYPDVFGCQLADISPAPRFANSSSEVGDANIGMLLAAF
jgi:hypothetical protein